MDTFKTRWASSHWSYVGWSFALREQGAEEGALQVPPSLGALGSCLGEQGKDHCRLRSARRLDGALKSLGPSLSSVFGKTLMVTSGSRCVTPAGLGRQLLLVLPWSMLWARK